MSKAPFEDGVDVGGGMFVENFDEEIEIADVEVIQNGFVAGHDGSGQFGMFRGLHCCMKGELRPETLAEFRHDQPFEESLEERIAWWGHGFVFARLSNMGEVMCA